MGLTLSRTSHADAPNRPTVTTWIMTFWRTDHLKLDDLLNAEIWDCSPGQQDHIQPYKPAWDVGAVGAQQAMRYPFRLPWVPDPIGHEWTSGRAVVVVGSAYGAFVGGTGQKHAIDPAQYVAGSSQDFGSLFYQGVIRSRPYYRYVADLASSVVPTCRLLVLLDLCRVAFVQRAVGYDRGGDSVVRKNAELFAKYVESPTPADWIWRRIVGTEADTIVALGTVAEHGLIRLFAQRLHGVQCRDSDDSSIQFSIAGTGAKWPKYYAEAERMIHHRAARTSPPYWSISGVTHTGVHRTWRLAVAYHPSSRESRKASAVHSTNAEYNVAALRAAYNPTC